MTINKKMTNLRSFPSMLSAKTDGEKRGVYVVVKHRHRMKLQRRPPIIRFVFEFLAVSRVWSLPPTQFG
jgi:hypothetical protein